MKADDLLAAMRHSGFRTTKIRVALADMFMNSTAPLSASDILDRFARNGLRPNKTTVYRELDSLERARILEAIDFGDGTRRFEASLNHHHHLVCLHCKTITDVSLQRDLHDEEQRIGERHNFTIQRHALEFFGLCARCQ
jgi:Fur family ferric uptake transcriptional regulator